jgi:glycosyltransferase involved in cell wall biosynthesis
MFLQIPLALFCTTVTRPIRRARTCDRLMTLCMGSGSYMMRDSVRVQAIATGETGLNPESKHGASAPAATRATFSVVVCTCDRPDTIERAIRSVAEQDYPSFDLIVIDQSRGSETRQIVERLVTEYPYVCYQHLDEVGLSRAYNTGVRATTGDYLAFTDDDCVAPANWLDTIARTLEAETDVDLIYGQVLLPSDLVASEGVDGVTPSLPIARRRRMNRREGFEVFGMGANFAMRRSLFDRVGTFDEALGGGAPLKSAQDFDYTYRVFCCGGTVLLDPEVIVYHYGFRSFAQWPATERAYCIGVGGFYAKHMRAGDMYATYLLAKTTALWTARAIKRTLMPPRDPAWARVGNLLMGIRESFQFGVDRRRRLYTTRAVA